MHNSLLVWQGLLPLLFPKFHGLHRDLFINFFVTALTWQMAKDIISLDPSGLSRCVFSELLTTNSTMHRHASLICRRGHSTQN